MLSSAECMSFCNRVFDLRAHWQRLDPACEAYALGAASYLALGGDAYRARAAALNPVLAGAFADLHAALFEVLGPALRAAHDGPVGSGPGFALPGFQILLVGDDLADPRGNVAGPHWDWNFLTMPWEPPLPAELELSRFASFTLPLSLPAAGGGLLVWESVTSVDVDEHAASRDLRQWEATDELTSERPAVHHAYAVGTLVVHSGHVVHQIAPWELAAGDARVTLQGHALFHQGMWQVYW